MLITGNNRKMQAFLIVILFLLSLLQGVLASPIEATSSGDGSGDLSAAPLNPQYVTFKEKLKDLRWPKINYDLQQLGYMPTTIDTEHLKGKKIPKTAFPSTLSAGAGDSTILSSVTANPPVYFDLRTLGKVTPVKNQGSCGSCWAFASYGSLESEQLPVDTLDLSENNLKNTHGFDAGPCSGGNHQMSIAYLTRWSGPINESADPYSPAVSTSPIGVLPIEHVQEALLIPARSGPLDNDNIKMAMQSYGAVYSVMYWGGSYFNSANNAYYYGGTTYPANHAIAIVGWDDTIDRNKFTGSGGFILSPPPGDGAFIAKNSWGTSFGDQGYFYISYYDAHIGEENAVFIGGPIDTYDAVYEYDPLGWVTSIGYNSDTTWMANVFTAQSEEEIDAVSLYTPEVNSNYQVTIYLDPSPGPVSSAGPALQTQGVIAIPGYHTVSLPTPVSITPGQRFSVVVKLQSPNYRYPIAIETPLTGYSSKATSNQGQSYVSRDGKTWTDLTQQVPNANVCLKVFTRTLVPIPPIAVFTASPTGGVSPLAVRFTDQSSGTPTSWLWNFGDGGTDTQQNPTYTYTVQGTYSVTLTSTNHDGSSTLTKQNYITVTTPPPPTAAFTASPTSGVAPFTVQFTDQSTGIPTSWMWTFGDGGSSAVQNPFHQYTTPGTYSVTLTATNGAGSTTLTKQNYIAATIPAPVAAFTGLPTTGIAPVTVQFTDTSTNTPTSWTWTFGDGTTDTRENPSHTYTSAGTYTVSLTVSNTGGGTTVTKSNYIMVTMPPAPIIADLSSDVRSGSPPLKVQFKDKSSGSPTSWSWDFGDGIMSAQQDPIHEYSNAGMYTVTLIAQNDNLGVGSKVVKKFYIKVAKVRNKGYSQAVENSINYIKIS